MKSMKGLLLVTALALADFCLSETAWAVEVFHQNQRVASATFISTDDSGCVMTDANIVGVEASRQFPPDQRESSTTGFVRISQFDYCTGEQLVMAEGLESLADPADLQFSSTLDSATLNTVVNVWDFVSNNSVAVRIDLN